MDEIISSLIEKLCAKNISDYRIINYSEDCTLTIAGSFDFSYYHNIEIYFYGTTYISCSTNFANAKLRIATSNERKLIEPKLDDGINDLMFCFVISEETNKNLNKHYIIAKDINFKEGTVYYYKRQGLQENERIAGWIK